MSFGGSLTFGKKKDIERTRTIRSLFQNEKQFSDLSGAQDTSEARLAKGSSTERLRLDQEAIDKIISDVLGGEGGLASIFGAEQAGGIFNSTVAAQASGDLAANLVGELAKLTAVRESDTVDRGQVSGSTREQSRELGGRGLVESEFTGVKKSRSGTNFETTGEGSFF